MSNSTSTLNDIISFLKAGEEFYLDAADEAKNPVAKDTFRDLAATRSAAVQELSAKVEQRGDEPSNASWVEQARAFYTSAKSAFVDTDEAFIADLEEHEDRTLEKLRTAIEDVKDADVRAILARHLSVFSSTHAKMKSLKKTYVAS